MRLFYSGIAVLTTDQIAAIQSLATVRNDRIVKARQRYTWVRRRFWLLIFLVLLFGGVRIVSAHANLIRSEPAANAILDKAPGQVRLWFSETPEPSFSQVQL